MWGWESKVGWHRACTQAHWRIFAFVYFLIVAEPFQWTIPYIMLSLVIWILVPHPLVLGVNGINTSGIRNINLLIRNQSINPLRYPDSVHQLMRCQQYIAIHVANTCCFSNTTCWPISTEQLYGFWLTCAVQCGVVWNHSCFYLKSHDLIVCDVKRWYRSHLRRRLDRPLKEDGCATIYSDVLKTSNNNIFTLFKQTMQT